jgi:hypothetical protein
MNMTTDMAKLLQSLLMSLNLKILMSAWLLCLKMLNDSMSFRIHLFMPGYTYERLYCSEIHLVLDHLELDLLVLVLPVDLRRPKANDRTPKDLNRVTWRPWTSEGHGHGAEGEENVETSLLRLTCCRQKET